MNKKMLDDIQRNITDIAEMVESEPIDEVMLALQMSIARIGVLLAFEMGYDKEEFLTHTMENIAGAYDNQLMDMEDITKH